MNEVVLLAAFTVASIRIERSWNTIIDSGASIEDTTDALRIHIDALERVHAMSTLDDERATVVGFLNLWDQRPNTPPMFVGLVEAACYRWLLDPPVTTRAIRLATERQIQVADEHGVIHCPSGRTLTPGGPHGVGVLSEPSPVTASPSGPEPAPENVTAHDLKGAIDSFLGVKRDTRCCNRDSDGDGNCDKHSSPGVRRTVTNGEQVLTCYRGACNEPAHPCGYNRVTHGLYCLGCATQINTHSIRTRAPGGEFFPLLKFLSRVTEGGSYHVGLILVRSQPETTT